MTILVGMLCEDGVVIGADSSATFGTKIGQYNYNTIEQPIKKISIIGNKIIVATTGSVGLGQRFIEVVRGINDPRDVFKKRSPIEAAKAVCKETIEDFQSTYLTKFDFGAIIAYPYDNRPVLIEFQQEILQPEVKNENLWYVSMGGGQTIADPFLGLMRKAFCPKKPPPLSTGTFIVSWTLTHTIDVNAGGIKEPFQLAVLEKAQDGNLSPVKLDHSRLEEHAAFVEEAYSHLSDFPEILSEDNAPEVPEPQP